MIKVTLPYPPSANLYWRNYRGMTVISTQAKAYKKEVAAIAHQQRLVPLQGRVIVSMRFYRPRKVGDLDNRIKCTLDSLNGLAWLDDKQVVEIHCYRHDDKATPRVELEIEEVQA